MTTRMKTGVAVLVVAGAVAVLPSAAAEEHARYEGSARTEAVVRGDAWIDYSLGREAVRRFTIDVRGNPYKIVDGKLVQGDARGTVVYDHYFPDRDQHNYGTIDIDYVMTGGPVAVLSGLTRQETGGTPAGSRVSISVYDSPDGRRHDRLGFSWGAVDGRCMPTGFGPAPFTRVIRFDGFLGDFRVRHAELPSADGLTEGPPPTLCPPQ